MERHTRANSVYRRSTANSCSAIKQPRGQDAYAIVVVGLLGLIAPLIAQDQPSAPLPPQIEKKQLDALTPAIQRKFEELKIWFDYKAVYGSGNLTVERTR
jgi:hypothetical protein